MISGQGSRTIEVTYIRYRVKGHEVIFSVEQNGIEVAYAQDISSYLNRDGKVDRKKIEQAIMVSKLSGAFILEVDNKTNKVIRVIR